MKTEIANEILNKVFKTALVQGIVKLAAKEDVSVILRKYSEGQGRDSSDVPDALREDPDAYKADAIEEDTRFHEGERSLYVIEDDRNTKYVLKIYELVYKPGEVSEPVEVEVDGEKIVLQPEMVKNLISQGKANKYVCGIMLDEDQPGHLGMEFDYNDDKINGTYKPQPRAKFSFFINKKKDPPLGWIDQTSDVRKDFMAYFTTVKKNIEEYNKNTSKEMYERTGIPQPAEAAPAAAAPPMGGGMPPMM